MSSVDLLQGQKDFQNGSSFDGLGSSQNFPNFPTAEKSSQQDEISLNQKQRAAIELLALGRSFVLTAKEVGVDRRTIFNWRKDDWFQSELRRRHQEIWGDAGDRIRMLVDPSIEVLCEHLNERYDRNRFRAANAILRLANLRQAKE
jgi:hypothetical protein